MAMLFGAVAWYCTLVPYQTFAQQEAYEALSRYRFSYSIYVNVYNHHILKKNPG